MGVHHGVCEMMSDGEQTAPVLVHRVHVATGAQASAKAEEGPDIIKVLSLLSLIKMT